MNTKKALIVYPDVPDNCAVFRTRLYNLVECLEAAGWDSPIDTMTTSARGKVATADLVVLIGRAGWDETEVGNAAAKLYENQPKDRPFLDWHDIDDIQPATPGAPLKFDELSELKSRNTWPPREWREVANVVPGAADKVGRRTQNVGEIAIRGIAITLQEARPDGSSSHPASRLAPAGILSRGQSYRKLRFRNSNIEEVGWQTDIDRSDRDVVLSSEGDVAAARESGEVLVWKDGSSRTERFAGLSAVVGFSDDSVRLLDVRSPWPQVIALLISDPESAAVVTVGPSGHWAIHERWDVRGSIAGAFLVGGTLTLSDTGEPSWRATIDEGIEFPTLVDGVDVLSTTSREVIAVWGRTPVGERVGRVFARAALEPARWRRVTEAKNVASMSLVRDRPTGVGPTSVGGDVATLFIEAESGEIVGPSDLDLAG